MTDADFERTVRDALADAAAHVSPTRTLADLQRRIERRMTSHHLPDPDMGDALVTAGAMCHFIAAAPDLADRFARWAEHCPGDLDAELVTDYLSKVHDLVAPDCATPAREAIRQP